jgi:hypothetical protein
MAGASRSARVSNGKERGAGTRRSYRRRWNRVGGAAQPTRGTHCVGCRLPIRQAAHQMGSDILPAAGLNARGVLYVRGGRWHVSNVENLINAPFDGREKTGARAVPPAGSAFSRRGRLQRCSILDEGTPSSVCGRFRRPLREAKRPFGHDAIGNGLFAGPLQRVTSLRRRGPRIRHGRWFAETAHRELEVRGKRIGNPSRPSPCRPAIARGE